MKLKNVKRGSSMTTGTVPFQILGEVSGNVAIVHVPLKTTVNERPCVGTANVLMTVNIMQSALMKQRSANKSYSASGSMKIESGCTNTFQNILA